MKDICHRTCKYMVYNTCRFWGLPFAFGKMYYPLTSCMELAYFKYFGNFCIKRVSCKE